MLFRQQRGRHQHRHLIAAHDRDEGGAQRDFGLAETDVAANQPVHRLACGHVGDHGLDGALLVRGFFKTEGLRQNPDSRDGSAQTRGPGGRRAAHRD